MVLRGTARALSLLGVRAGELTEAPAADDDWYLNVFWLERRKCVLLTHAGTLFSAFLPDVRVAEMRPLGRFVVDALEAELRAEGLPTDGLGLLDPDDLRLATTASRSTLGFMNEMVWSIRYQVASAGGLDRCEGGAVNHQLRRMPHNRGGYLFPIEQVAQRLAGRTD